MKDGSVSRPRAPRLAAFLFVVNAATCGIWLFWIFYVERYIFPRAFVVAPALLWIGFILYYYLGGRTWIEKRKSWRVRIGIAAVWVLCLRLLSAPALVAVLIFYVVCRLASEAGLDRLPARLWSPRAQLCVALALCFGLYPLANHLYILGGIFYYVGEVEPPLMKPNRFYGVNASHHRGPETARERSGARRLMALGDSVTFGFAYPWDEAWPALTREELAGRGFSGVEVINMAMPSQSLVQIAAQLDRYLEWSPDTFLLMTGLHWSKSLAHRERIESFRGPLLPLEREWLPVPPMLLEFFSLGFVLAERQGAEELAEENRAVYASALDGLVTRARAAGVSLVLLEYPALLYPGEIDAVNAEIVARRGIDFVPLRHLMGSDDFYLGDGLHPKPAGHRRMAETIAGHLAARWGEER